jgi:Glycosyl hydrolase 2 galactose-binding domain-like/Exo-beta-D-glucosaminidase Ig-fold domain/Glycosyl hydrolases family 2/Glycosyl hydrolases family 2, TIM barrel domain
MKAKNLPKQFQILVAACLFVSAFRAAAEVPGEFRPKPIASPAENAEAKGVEVQPTNTYPVSAAPLVNTAKRKPKLANPGAPTLRGDALVFNAGWEMIEAPRLKKSGTGVPPVSSKPNGRDARATTPYLGARLSRPGVDTHEWYDATVPGTVLTTLVNEGVYPNPYYGLNNLLIPESLNKQDYWYRTEFTVPKTFDGRELTLQFNGINYYAEVWFNGQYLGHITGAFIRGKFDVTKFAKPGGTNVLAVMVAPPPDPGIPSEQSVKGGPGDNGGKLCLDGPTFECTEGWDWIPGIRDRDTGIWQDVLLRATGPVMIEDPQVITKLPLPDTSRADVIIKTGLRNAADSVEKGVLKGSFEGVQFEQPVTLQSGETKIVGFAPADYPQLSVEHPRLWWPNGYGKPELYHLKLSFVMDDKKESDHTALHFGIREMSYEFEVKKPDGGHEHVEFTPTLALGAGGHIIDNRRDTMVWGLENKAKRDAAIVAAGGKPPTTPFWWGQDQQTTVGLWPGAESSPALRVVNDSDMGPYLVVKVNGQKIECLGGDWGMDDAMKRVSPRRLEPYIRMTRDAHMTMIRNWAGQSTSEAFYDLCDQYGILVWNDFWDNTEAHNYMPADFALSERNVADMMKRFRNHPSIALWCSGNEGVPPEPLHEAYNKLIYQLDGTRYYQPNSRLVNMDNSGPWSNLPLDKYFDDLNRGFSTEIGASSIPELETLRTFIPKADRWPYNDVWAYHDLHSGGAGSYGSTFERLTNRYGAPLNAADACRKAQMLNYETFRAIYEGFNSRMWHDCSGVIVWMSQPSWPSLVWNFYSWDYDPDASLFGAMKGAEPVHIQMNLPDCAIAIVNHRAQPLVDVTASAAIYDLTGRLERSSRQTLTALADTCTDAFNLDFPASGAHFVKLELRDPDGKLLSQNFYWHARDERQLQQLNSLPLVELEGKVNVRRGPNGPVAEGRVINPSQTPALEVRLTLRNAKSGKRVLPVYYDDNYFSLLPGESREFHIETRVGAVPHDDAVDVSVDGWNIKSANLK